MALKHVRFVLTVVEKLLEFLAIFAILSDLVREVDAMLASLDPGGLWHRRVNLLQIELALDALLVHVWDHVRRFNERHGKGESQL